MLLFSNGLCIEENHRQSTSFSRC